MNLGESHKFEGKWSCYNVIKIFLYLHYIWPCGEMNEQAEAELCQDHFKLGLALLAYSLARYATLLPSQSYLLKLNFKFLHLSTIHIPQDLLARIS